LVIMYRKEYQITHFSNAILAKKSRVKPYDQGRHALKRAMLFCLYP